MAGRLEGKRALVTGAASGIGEATARRFAAEGAQVAGIDRTAFELEGVLALQADVTREDEVERAVAAAVDAFGGLDVVVANAAIQPTEDGPVHELPLEVWQRVIDVNLTGVFLTCKHGVRALLASGGGSVVCTSSPTGLFGLATGYDAYSSAKAGVHGLFRVMAAEYARQGIRVNAVVPGYTETPLTDMYRDEEGGRAHREVVATIPLGRGGTAEEVASMMVFLASDEASYATGGAFFVDGGITAV